MALERLRLVRPAQRAEGPEGGREPGIQHIGVAIENGFRRMMSDFRRFGPGTGNDDLDAVAITFPRLSEHFLLVFRNEDRSEERRVGKECDRTCRVWWLMYP